MFDWGDGYKNTPLVAKMLLEENKLKGVEIADMLNFSSYFSFSRAFKEKFNISPQEYKKRFNNNQDKHTF